jgi:hypothetical protein
VQGIISCWNIRIIIAIIADRNDCQSWLDFSEIERVYTNNFWNSFGTITPYWNPLKLIKTDTITILASFSVSI